MQGPSDFAVAVWYRYLRREGYKHKEAVDWITVALDDPESDEGVLLRELVGRREWKNDNTFENVEEIVSKIDKHFDLL